MRGAPGADKLPFSSDQVADLAISLSQFLTQSAAGSRTGNQFSLNSSEQITEEIAVIADNTCVTSGKIHVLP